MTTAAFTEDQLCSHGISLAAQARQSGPYAACRQCVDAHKRLQAEYKQVAYDLKKLKRTTVPAKLRADYDRAHQAWLRREIEDFRIRDGKLWITWLSAVRPQVVEHFYGYPQEVSA